MTDQDAEHGGRSLDRSSSPPPAHGAWRAYVSPFFRRLDVSDDTAGRKSPDTFETNVNAFGPS